ncbi:cyclic nucleotide-binding domain-containing protein [Oceanicoccus sp. KOV_DT_Chl]|uniref:cyclic nucleotide-binding domain-containing protein n=1 Tax=Oceanicoccus sp. KOV_DT_Chl TaxID=1904639 RepID=UPI000C7E1A55|nr:cyclic nucleotide-binding domain-containing protein [Oceanicoccus sp. KOV_DT_Chl]
MNITDLSGYQQHELESLLSRIPFFKELQLQSKEQLEVMLTYSCVVDLEPGETIMRRGDRGSWLYFLIKGRLSVYWDQNDAEPLNTITPGELFGDLALLCDHERKATVAAERGSKNALLFATDFKPFGDLNNFSMVNLETKLTFYRTMVHSIRWRLEVNRMKDPSHKLTNELRQVPVHSGAKGTKDELHSLARQAQYLADVLDRWNSDGGHIQDVMVVNAAQ